MESQRTFTGTNWRWRGDGENSAFLLATRPTGDSASHFPITTQQPLVWLDHRFLLLFKSSPHSNYLPPSCSSSSGFLLLACWPDLSGTGGHPLRSSSQQKRAQLLINGFVLLVESGSRSLYLAVVRASALTSPVPPHPLSSCQAQWVWLWIWMDLYGSHPTRVHRGKLVPFQCAPSEPLGEHQTVFWRSCCELGTRRLLGREPLLSEK